MYNGRTAQEGLRLVTRRLPVLRVAGGLPRRGACPLIGGLEEPRRNSVHTTAASAAIPFRSIPSCLLAGATASYLIHYGATPCLDQEGDSATTVCLRVHFSLHRDKLLTPLGPTHGFFSQWPMSQIRSQEFLLNVQFFSLKTASIHIKVL